VDDIKETACQVIEWIQQAKRSFDYSNDTSGCTKGEGCLDQLSNYQLLKDDCSIESDFFMLLRIYIQ
jgi:hypothetical protein